MKTGAVTRRKYCASRQVSEGLDECQELFCTHLNDKVIDDERIARRSYPENVANDFENLSSAPMFTLSGLICCLCSTQTTAQTHTTKQ